MYCLGSFLVVVPLKWCSAISSNSEKLQSLGTDLSVLTEHLNLLLLVDPFPIIKSCFMQMILIHIYTFCFMQMKTFFHDFLTPCYADDNNFSTFLLGASFSTFPPLINGVKSPLPNSSPSPHSPFSEHNHWMISLPGFQLVALSLGACGVWYAKFVIYW